MREILFGQAQTHWSLSQIGMKENPTTTTVTKTTTTPIATTITERTKTTTSREVMKTVFT